MKKIIVIMFLTVFTFQAQAGVWDVIGAILDVAAGSSSSSGSGRPDRYEERFRPRVSCAAKDNGWEEHYGGHSDCRSCLKKHGHCVEVCSSSFYSCKVEGRDYRGYTMTLEARGEDRYDAERAAMRRCYRELSECRVLSCESESEVVSRRSCR